MCGAGMALVRLPPSCVAAARAASGEAAAADVGGATSADAKWVQDALHHVHRIECPAKCIAGCLYVRLSGEEGRGAGTPAVAGVCLRGSSRGRPVCPLLACKHS